MMVLAVNRRLPQLLELAAERTWQPLEGRELRDTTLGIIGFGSIGRAIAEVAAPFGPRILARAGRARPRPDEAPLPPGVELGGPETFGDVVAAADFVILALPLTPETEDLVDDRVLALMKRTRLAGQRRPRPADRGAGAPAGPPRGDDRRGGPRRLPRGAAPARLGRSTACRT